MKVSFQQWGRSDSTQQILLIHGWGMNSGVMSDIARHLEQIDADTLIRSVDLPGYGHSASYTIDALGGAYTARTLAQSLAPLLQGKQTVLIAWSMGGLVAIELLAGFHEQPVMDIAKLILVSSTPRFVQDDDWQCAVEAGVFEAFSQSLAVDHHAALRRFMAIQALGSRSAREDIKTLQAQLFKRGEPDPLALKYGLNILLKEDKRQLLRQISDIPICLISGKKDTLVNYQGQRQLAEQDNISLFTIPAAGHAPFISHPEEFNTILHNII